MKRIILTCCFLCSILTAMADWTHGTAYFKGDRPKQQMSIGGVNVWYNGTLKQVMMSGGVDYWEATGDICVAFPKNYNGRKLSFKSINGTVQIQTLR